ncbi:hypothetical protein ILYODFUR_035346 [Ilyodon furcidens]|uniref:Uncharacterized protein n=1 Tax=Ilyodon furcidens TaxID=33524 RepID=A0ABV0T496_9TELE
MFPAGGEHGDRSLLLGRSLPAAAPPGSLSVDEEAAAAQPLPAGQAQVSVNYVTQSAPCRFVELVNTRVSGLQTSPPSLCLFVGSCEGHKYTYIYIFKMCKSVLALMMMKEGDDVSSSVFRFSWTGCLKICSHIM